MAHLSLAGTSDDRRRLLLVDDQGAEHTLDVTPDLRAAVRDPDAAASRPGQLEITMDSALRPRDIQARIRAGETPEAVAEAARTTVEKVMPYAAPVLAERQHVADRAQQAAVRRPAGESGSHARVLADAVETHLRGCNVDPEIVDWDAWRREDGRWSVTGHYATPARAGTAHLTYDARGNFVVLEDDDARWLVGEPVDGPAPAQDDLQSRRTRRLSAVSNEQLPLGPDAPLGDDAIGLVSDPDPAAADHESADEPDTPAAPAEPTAHEEDAGSSDEQDEDERSADDEPASPAARRPVSKRRGRASVPSWDEIMFGGPSEGGRA